MTLAQAKKREQAALQSLQQGYTAERHSAVVEAGNLVLSLERKQRVRRMTKYEQRRDKIEAGQFDRDLAMERMKFRLGINGDAAAIMENVTAGGMA